MTAVTALPFSRPLTRADLEDLPDDGHRYELIDGTLIVSPGPALPHQDVVGNLYLLLRAACPPHLKVVLAPFASAPTLQVATPPDSVPPPSADTNDVPAGIGSVTTTPVESEGPSFATTSV